MKNIIWWVVGVLAAIAAWYLLDEAVWKYLFFLREPIIMGLFLLFFPLVSKSWLSALLKNLFVLRNRWQLAAVIVSAVAAGVSVVLVGSIILHNAPSRFDVPAGRGLSQFWQYVIAIALSLCTCIVATDLSQEKLKKQEIQWGIFAGGIFSMGLLWIVNLITTTLETNSAFREVLVNIASLAKHGTEGYLENGELTLGHSTAVAFLLFGVVTYLVVGLFFNPRSQSHRPEAPALLYLLMLVSIVTLLFGGATFYLDYFRFPILIVFVLYSAFTYFAWSVDHVSNSHYD